VTRRNISGTDINDEERTIERSSHRSTSAGVRSCVRGFDERECDLAALFEPDREGTRFLEGRPSSRPVAMSDYSPANRTPARAQGRNVFSLVYHRPRQRAPCVRVSPKIFSAIKLRPTRPRPSRVISSRFRLAWPTEAGGRAVKTRPVFLRVLGHYS